MRLYRIDQPTVAQYLTFFRKEEELSINQITSIFPESYMHTVGHWFRKDMGGSIPIPEDIEPLKRALTSQNELFGILKRTALKFQTVKASIKGRNPGDFLELKGEEEVRSFLRKLFITPKEYKKYFLA